jgi:hypothetical protein
MVKNMCFLLRGHKFISRGDRVCIPPSTLPIKSLLRRVPYPTNKEFSYT